MMLQVFDLDPVAASIQLPVTLNPMEGENI